ncbi:hypothetical protein CUR178_03051 [Leishmania enriettii]|uniref:Uncharacterized protein n=1 Tax=Leishmania enriettii TaxID=5663 RepID=A0A836H0Q2_LEIEN|nr:hypothetical protein CUR178_03051 [Leishmania enriettii]
MVVRISVRASWRGSAASCDWVQVNTPRCDCEVHRSTKFGGKTNIPIRFDFRRGYVYNEVSA